jgi:hypothetical protein
MDNQQEATLSLVAALFVLLTAMVDPRLTIALTLLLLLAFAVYQLRHRPEHKG